MVDERRAIGSGIAAMTRRFAGRAEPFILMYHRVAHVATDPWGLAVHPEVFARQMEFFAAHRTIAPLDWLVDELRAGRRARGVIAITFDDGYRDVLEHAKPVLDGLDIPATVFLVSGALGSSSGFWWDRLAATVFDAVDLSGATRLTFLSREQHNAARRAVTAADYDALHTTLWAAIRFLPPAERDAAVTETAAQLGRPAASQAPVMTLEDVRALQVGGRITVGAHTVTHSSLPSLPIEDQRLELAQSRSVLEALTGSPVRGLAYPFGDHDEPTARIAQDAGFAYAVTSAARTAGPADDPWRLPRFDVKGWNADECRRFLDASVTILGRPAGPGFP